MLHRDTLILMRGAETVEGVDEMEGLPLGDTPEGMGVTEGVRVPEGLGRFEGESEG